MSIERYERIARLYPEMMRAMGRIRSVVHDSMDLTYNQYKMLLTIYDHGNCSLNLLARELGIAMSSASEMVDKLVNMEFVYRGVDADNRRQVVIQPTGKGEALIRELRRGILENYRQLLEKLPDHDQERLVEAFETVTQVLGKLEQAENIGG